MKISDLAAVTALCSQLERLEDLKVVVDADPAARARCFFGDRHMGVDFPITTPKALNLLETEIKRIKDDLRALGVTGFASGVK